MTDEEIKYKEDQKEVLKSHIVGSNDTTGNTITKIISKGDEYVIYEIETKVLSDSIKIYIHQLKEEDKSKIDNFSVVREKFIKIKGLLYKTIDNPSTKARIGHILSHAISGKPEEANNQFDNLILEIEKEYTNQSKHRINYLLTTVIILMIGVAFSIATYYNGYFTNHLHLRHFIFISTSSFLGGFISITRRLKSNVFEMDVSTRLYIFFALERMLIALVAGVLVYFAIQSNILFGIVKELDKPIFGYLLFSAVAGFSETLIPNLLIKLENEKEIKT